jgi:hypothetical protein
LLAIAECQATSLLLEVRYREQARSHRGYPVNSESEYTSLLPIGLIAFTTGCFSVDVTFQNNKNRLSNEPESQPAA